MKHLLAAVLVAVSMSANALEYAAPNKAGGEIRLTSADCPNKGKPWAVMYSFGSSGSVSYGCWFITDDTVHVQWQDGGSSVFRANTFKPVGSKSNNKGTEL